MATGQLQLSSFSARAVPTLWNLRPRRPRFGDVALIVFLLTQCFDGVFTYVGVVSFGPGVEANPILALLMTSLGEGTGLLAAKSVAILLGIALHLRHVHAAVASLAGFYLVVAVLPWMAILFT